MNWHDLLPVAVFLVSILSSWLSGMAGGGGSFILTPFYILIGLTPQQAVATGKFGSFGLTTGAIIAFRKKLLEDKRFSIFIVGLSLAMGLLAAFLIQQVDNKSLQVLMGVFMLGMVPFMLQKAKGIHKGQATKVSQAVGTLLLAPVMLLQGILSSGIGALVSAIFIIFFGKSALQANILKRKTSIVINSAVVVALLGSGLINFTYGISSMAGGLIGGYAGSHIALKKGDEFARYALLIFMVISGIWLLVSA